MIGWLRRELEGDPLIERAHVERALRKRVEQAKAEDQAAGTPSDAELRRRLAALRGRHGWEPRHGWDA